MTDPIDVERLKQLKQFVHFEAQNNRGSGLYRYWAGDSLLYRNIIFEGNNNAEDDVYFTRNPETNEFSMATNTKPIDNMYVHTAYIDHITNNPLNMTSVNFDSEVVFNERTYLLGGLDTSGTTNMGNIVVHGYANIKQNIIAESDVRVDGGASFNGIVDSNGGLRVNDTAIFDADTIILTGNTLYLSSIEPFETDIQIATALDNQNVFIGGTGAMTSIRGLNVYDTSIFHDNTIFQSGLQVTGSVTFHNPVFFDTTLTASGVAHFLDYVNLESGLTVTGNSTFTYVYVRNDVSISGNLVLSSNSYFYQDVYIQNALVVTGHATFTTGYFNGGLDVTGDVKISDGALHVQNLHSLVTSGTIAIGSDTNTVQVDIGNGPNVSDIIIGGQYSIQNITIGNQSAPNPCNILIGGPRDTVTIAGSFNYVTSTELQVVDKNIQLNASANGPNTSASSGLYIRDSDNDFQGYVITDTVDSSRFRLKAPNSGGIIYTPVITTGGYVSEAVVQSISGGGNVIIYNDFTVTGNMFLTNGLTVSTLNVSGATTMNTTVIYGELTVSGANSNLYHINISGNATFQSSTVNLDTVTVSGANTRLDTLTVSGNTTFNSPVTIGNTLTVSGNSINTQTLNVSGDSTLQSNMYVSGDARLNYLYVTNTTNLYGNLTVGAGTLTNVNNFKVDGSATFSFGLNSLDTVTVSGAGTRLDTVTVTGSSTFVGGALVGTVLTVSGVPSNLTTLNVSSTALFLDTLTVTSGIDTRLWNLNVSGNLNISGNLNTNGSATFTSLNTTNAGFFGYADFFNGLSVTGLSLNTANLNVSGGSTFTTSVVLTRLIATGGTNTDVFNLNVSGSAVINALTISGSMTFNDAVFRSTLIVSGAQTRLDTLTVSGIATFNSPITVSGNLTISGFTNRLITYGLNVTGNAYIGGVLSANSIVYQYVTTLLTAQTEFARITIGGGYANGRISVLAKKTDAGQQMIYHEEYLISYVGSRYPVISKYRVCEFDSSNYEITSLWYFDSVNNLIIMETSRASIGFTTDIVYQLYGDFGPITLSKSTSQGPSGTNLMSMNYIEDNASIVISGNTTFNNGIVVSGNIIQSGSAYRTLVTNLNVSGNSTYAGNLFIGQNLTVTGTLYAQDLVVDGPNTFIVSGGSSKINTLNVTGNATMNSRLHVVGGVTFVNTLYVGGGVTFNDRLLVTGGVSFGSGLQVSGSVSFNNTLTVNGGVTFNDRLLVTGGVSFGSGLQVSGSVSFNNTLTVNGGVTFNSNFIVGGGASFVGGIQVTGGASFGGNIVANNYKAYHWTGYIGSITPPIYYRLGKLGTLVDSNNGGCIRIQGTVGRRETNGQGLVDITVSTRQAISIGGSIYTPTATTSLSNVSNYIDFVLYLEADNTYTLYMMASTSFSSYEFIITSPSGQFTSGRPVQLYEPTGTNVTPTGTLSISSILNRLTFYNIGGNVGLGVTGPTAKLTIASDLALTSNSGTGYLRFYSNNAINYIQSGTFNTAGSSADLVISNMNASSEWMRVKSNGNVGIGQSNPGSLLDVNGTLNIAGSATFVGELTMSGGNRVSTSAGYIWVSRTTPVNQAWYGICYGNGLYVAVGKSGTNTTRAMSSPDGINWTSGSTPNTDGGMNSVCYGAGFFVAVANSSTSGTRVMTSPDGQNWTNRTEATGVWYSVCYGEGLFVAVGADGTDPGPYTGRVMTSPDGILWTARTPYSNDKWYSVCYGNGRFVAVQSNGVSSNMYSNDGITWTQATINKAFAGFSVCYGNGLFVAVGSGNNSTERICTSSDGITWTTVVTASITNVLNGVYYGNGLFVAIGQNTILTSRDAVNWTSRTAPSSDTWQSICYGNGQFVAVNTNGASSRAMTSGFPAISDFSNNNIFQGPQFVRNDLTVSGTTTLNSILRIEGSTPALTFSGTALSSTFTIGQEQSGGVLASNTIAGNGVIRSNITGAIFIQNGNTTNALVVSGNNVGIGTSNPSLSLSLSTSGATIVTVNNPLWIRGANLGTSDTNTTSLLTLNNNNGNENYIRFYQVRKGAGTTWTTADTRIERVTDTTSQGFLEFQNGVLFYFGDIKASGSIYALSDRRIKENIQLIQNPLSKILDINGVSYNRTDTKDKKKHIGVIAQDILSVCPEAVQIPENKDDYLSVNYNSLVGLLIEGIKEQHREIQSLKDENKDLRMKIEKIMSFIQMD